MSDVARNVEFVRRIFADGWNRQQFGFMEGRTADTIPFRYNGDTVTVPGESLEGLVAVWREAFPDLEFEICDLIGQDDTVAVSLVFRGTHRGEWFGLPPSGQPVAVDEMMIFRFDGDRLVEMWEVFDEQGLRAQITARDVDDTK